MVKPFEAPTFIASAFACGVWPLNNSELNLAKLALVVKCPGSCADDFQFVRHPVAPKGGNEKMIQLRQLLALTYQLMSNAMKINMLELARGNAQAAFHKRDAAANAGLRALGFVELRRCAVEAATGLVRVDTVLNVTRA